MSRKTKTYPVTKPYLPSREALNGYIDEIYASNWLTNFGPLHKRLEDRLKSFLGVENLLLISNGTLALQIAYRALGLKGEVITTPFSFVATTSSLVWEGLTPQFADIDPETLTLDPREVEKKITARTSGIVPVHIYGNVCDVEALGEIAKRKNLKVVYDAAHAFGVRYKERSVLNFGDASILSFHATKLFHSIEGGAIVFREKAHLDHARDLINFGIDGPDHVRDLGINCKMNEFQAAMGLAVLDEFEGIQSDRKRVFEYYAKNLSDLAPAPAKRRGTANWAYYPILLKDRNQTLAFKDGLEKRGILTRRYFHPSLNQMPYLTDKISMPVSEDISDRILCLPFYSQLTDADLAIIVGAARELMGDLR